MKYFAVILALIAGVANAQDQSNPKNWAWGRMGTGSNTVYFIENTATNHAEFFDARGNTIKAAGVKDYMAGQRTLSQMGLELSKQRTLTLPSKVAAGRVQIAVTDKILIPRAAIATGGRIMARAVPQIALATTLAGLLAADDISWLQSQWMKREEETQTPIKGVTTITTPSGYSGAEFSSPIAGCSSSTMQNAALASGWSVFAPISYKSTTYFGEAGPGKTQWKCEYNTSSGPATVGLVTTTADSCPDGSQPVGGMCKEYEWRPATDTEMETAIEKMGDSQMPDVVQTLANNNIDIPGVGNGAASMTPNPTSVTGQPVSVTTTKQHRPDGGVDEKRVERRQDVTAESTGNTISNNYLTTNVTYVTTTYINNVKVEETEDKDPRPPTPPDTPDIPTEPQPEPVDYSFDDPAMPAVPELYEQKYPNGIAGVWQQKWPQMQNTAFMHGISGMFPTLSGGGSCPNMGLGFNLGFVNFGDHDFGPALACDLWSVLGLILLTSACFTAWKILF